MTDLDQSPGAFSGHSGAGRRRGVRSRLGAKPILAVALATSAVIGTALSTAGTAASAAAGAKSKATHAVFPRATGKLETMIVLVRNSAPAGASISAREASATRSQAAVVAELRGGGAQIVARTSVIDTVIAKMTPAQAKALRSNPAVVHVYPNSTIPMPKLSASGSSAMESGVSNTTRSGLTPAASPGPCGTASKPEMDPEALAQINQPAAQALGITGAGVTVAFLAGIVDQTNADFLRNAAFGKKGAPVITSQNDFSGDGPGVTGGDASVEGFGDASSIASQGNSVFDLSKFVNPAHKLPANCDIKVQGDAPGASLQSDVIFGAGGSATSSGFVQAINYAATHGVKVINESFGGNPFPDTANDLTRLANDAAVKAGVTVVASSGDSGITNTQGSPSTDPMVISAGASTSFRSYAQEAFGGINWPGWNGKYVDDNVSSISSSGFNQAGQTISLVAPGDLNWADCSANTKKVAAGFCNDWAGSPSNLQDFGGTSESSPFTAGAAADVIQAYSKTHGGKDPSPALVKQILLSSATDIQAPATEQGVGILNIGAAVKLAESLPGTSAKTHPGGVLLTSNQINVQGLPSTISSHPFSIINEGSSSVKVSLKTRQLAPFGTPTSNHFCLNPSTTATTGCPVTTNSFPIWSGVIEVYQAVNFSVAAGAARLSFSADYPNTGQASLLHFGLFNPSGAFSAYSLPQGLGDFGEVEVANPPAGKWTAVFFTEKDNGGSNGTSGNIQWQASTWKWVAGSPISPSSATIGAGKSTTATLKVTTPKAAGDTSQSIVVTEGTQVTTIPVTVRTQIATTTSGGSFTGVLTGGNGRGSPGGGPGEENTYSLNVPSGSKSLTVDIHMASNPSNGQMLGTQLVGYLEDPAGNVIGYSTNYTTTAAHVPEAVQDVVLYHANPTAGTWRVILDWPNPVSGAALSVPFTGTITFGAFAQTNNLPNSAATDVSSASGGTFAVNLCNHSAAPQSFFADARLSGAGSAEYPLANLLSSSTAQAFGATFAPFGELAYLVPPDSTEIQSSVLSTRPVTYDLFDFVGDPDISPAVKAPGVNGSQSGNASAVTYTSPEVAQGLWGLVTDQLGPYPAGGAVPANAQANVSVVSQPFNDDITTSTSDLWQLGTLTESAPNFTPAYLAPTACGSIGVAINPPSSEVGSTVHGVLYIDDFVLGSAINPGTTFVPSNFGLGILPSGDQIIGIPYTYTVTS